MWPRLTWAARWIPGRLLLACLLASLAPACFDNGEVEEIPDPPPPEQPEIDTYMGGLFVEVSVQGYQGSGVLAEAMFAGKDDAPLPVYEELPGSLFGCKVYEFDADGFLPGTEDIECTNMAGALDEGTMHFSVEGSGPEIPDCYFFPGQGYMCPGAAGSGADIAALDPTQGLYTIHDDTVTFERAEVGRFVAVQGAEMAANNGMFPIVDAIDEHTLVILNPQQDPELCGTTPDACQELSSPASYTTLAGMPGGRTAPVEAGSRVSFELTPGGEGDVPAFERSLSIGGGFTLDAASRTLINNVPVDGSAFTLGCDGEGGQCDDFSTFSLLNIIATDAPITPDTPPLAVPPPANKALQIVCGVPDGHVTVPAEVSEYIADAGVTRVRPVFMRMNDAYVDIDNFEAHLGVGHGVAGIETP